ncbi:MAG: nuclear transport factor 2 family protein [Candidatus Diapherotrites archaeon]|nr:nuclear transport factor 2 family protein [Candidatus Diapherotrites archaeon]
MEEKVLDNFLMEYEKASNSHDFKNVEPFIDVNAIYEFTDGSFKGIDEIRIAFEKTFNKIKDEKYQISKVKWLYIGDECAVCTFNFHWKGIVIGKMAEGSGRGTMLIVKGLNGMKIVHEHLCRSP